MIPADELLIADQAGFDELVRELEQEPLIGADTEAASFHRYHDRIYLLQLSSRSVTAVVDPLGVPDLSRLGALLGSESVEFIFHDADYDLRLFQRQFGFRLRRLFDTRVAAQFLNEPGIGLAAMLEKWLGVATDKRFQRADWSARPLTPAMVEYAATDTRHLPELSDLLRAKLAEMGRLSWVAEECEILTGVEWAPADPPEVGFFRLKGARSLDPRGLAILREVFTWREQTASRLDRAAFRLVGNEALHSLAVRRPQTVQALGAIPGIGAENAARRGAEILEAIGRGLAVPEAELPRFERGPRYRPDPTHEERLVRLKETRTRLAAELNLAPGVLCANGTLEQIARAKPATLEELRRTPSVRAWQVAAIGAQLLAVVP
ncbi:MAG: HRDC domain-containing protein [Gemmatimonadota bacterium]